MDGPLAQLQRLSCVRDDRELFAELDLRLDAGELVELRGPNGSGKSTLLRILAGLFPDYAGELTTAQALYCGHKPGLAGALTPVENLAWYLRLDGGDLPRREYRHKIETVLAEVGLAGYEDVPCVALSAGQLRRVMLGRLRLARRSLWLLDEPLTALDDAGCALLRATLAAQLDQGGGVICATHQALDIDRARVLSLARVRQ